MTHAQTDITPASPARSLSCLQRPDKVPRYPEQHRFDLGHGLLRVLLHFDKPDAKPRVQVLANTAREDMQDVVFSHLADYRLPCLRPEDGTVSAVQEFHFRNTDRAPLPMKADPGPEFCVVMPRRELESPRMLSRSVEHVVVAATFAGDGKQAPEVKVIHSTASTSIERMVREYVAEFRMPCRSGSENVQGMRQQFSFSPPGARRYVLKREAFSLAEFLGMTQGARQLQADFDFTTMNCPFKVDYTSYGPYLPNEVRVGSPRDPNRLPFLSWLKERQLSFANDEQANDLFGQTVQIDVPCGRLNLQPQPSPT
ncbi:hypothetical protein OOZ63_23740 [Paucibacter sp. PLA-PC-4]|uniref:hypothetical protein n=1 Tax=Paucibacter sp. PLA-PC-4 TaxID=2993655 RepID=UPI00224B0AA1|nr:hypothetical protein [Paucibacter sp. PLA-PC-4]MCX2864849.1 hypothetical protein [Paucibacter sp. PLA-PC-4]